VSVMECQLQYYHELALLTSLNHNDYCSVLISSTEVPSPRYMKQAPCGVENECLS
jgi:hypothetical protein